jgi:diguanylate cyclase (GGDEF)-like protein
MLDSHPLCCHLWTGDSRIIDCNEAAVSLYGFSSKQEHIERFKDVMPEYQPDGQSSFEKSRIYMKKAIDEGRCVFNWMHQMPDGTPIPSEVTLVRVEYKDGFIVASYTKDLREIKTLEEKVEEVYYDSLTEIHNRRYLDKVLDSLIKSLSQTEGSLSLMMIDIDHFKPYNDTYGHSEGDKCLKIVAEIIAKSITRETDFVARYGGEEFTVVLPYTDEDGARVIAEKLLDNIRNAKVPHSKSDVADYVTISIGVATGKVDYFQSGSDYIKKADEMLYMSKQNGRNKYKIFLF